MAHDYGNKIDKLMHTLLIVQRSPGRKSVKDLAEELSVDPRSIQRYIRTLREAGIPIDFDRELGGYRIRNGFFLPPVSLKLDEALALLHLGATVRKQEQIPLTGQAAIALDKLLNALPANIREELGDIDGHIEMKLPPAGPFHGIDEVHQVIKDAIHHRRAIECRYEGIRSIDQPELRDETFLFDPYRLVFIKRSWYAIGHHHGRDALRQLKLNRFTAISPTDHAYRIPRDFSLDSFFGDAWHMIKGEPTYDIRLRFDPQFAETIADTTWHQSQEIIYEDDGAIVFSCRVAGLEEIVWWVLGMGPHCRVIEPPELAERVARLADMTAAHYREPEVRSR
ncbi:MAG: WYL domain-containing protein [Phycisphaeraceae bacterium]|nr:WYL domain-containing protein [Phycisphaeraceae bacterium]